LATESVVMPISPGPSTLTPDPLIAEACEMLGVSLRQMYRLIKTGEVQGFVLGGRRRVTYDSLRRYREICIARGHQLLPLNHPGKRKRGRPRKPKPETSVAAE
jgi:excisionase family DNA binding protein